MYMYMLSACSCISKRKSCVCSDLPAYYTSTTCRTGQPRVICTFECERERRRLRVEFKCERFSARVLECSNAVYRVSHFQTREYNHLYLTLEYKFHVTCTIRTLIPIVCMYMYMYMYLFCTSSPQCVCGLYTSNNPSPSSYLILFPLHGTKGVLRRKRNGNETIKWMHETKRNLSLKTEDGKRKSASTRVNCTIVIVKW